MSARQPQPFPLSKLMDAADAEELRSQHTTLQAYGAMEGQHEARWWEYSMALYAIQVWQEAVTASHAQAAATALGGEVEHVWSRPLQIADVGGHNSKFPHSLVAITSEDILLIDPAAGATDIGPRVEVLAKSIEEAAASYLPHGQRDVITAISVIEHLEKVRPFFRAAHMLLKPGGLLFLTTDYSNDEGPDLHHYSWMRRRIYNKTLMDNLRQSSRQLGFAAFGRADWTWHGPQVYGYTLASLALVRV